LIERDLGGLRNLRGLVRGQQRNVQVKSIQQPFTVTLDGLIHGVGRQVNITRPGDKPIGYLKALQKIGGVLSVIPDLVEGKSKGETKTGRTEKARPTIRHPATVGDLQPWS
jgi:hypothetical protein